MNRRKTPLSRVAILALATQFAAFAAFTAGCATQAAPPQTSGTNVEMPPPSAKAVEADKKTNDAASNDNTRNTGWVVLAAGAGAGIVALGTSFVMLYDMGVRSSECNADKQCTTRGTDANSQISSLAGWNLGAWIVAAVGIGAGAFLVLTHPKETEKGTTAVGVTQTGSGLGLGFRSTF